MNRRLEVSVAAGLVLLAGWSASASAEMQEVRVAQQYGISYLPLMIMQRDHLLQKHAKAAGLGNIKVNWTKFAGGNVMNEALLSDSLQFASGGVAPMITLWARTHGNLNVKGVAAINSMPLLLNTTNPKVKTIKDFTDKDKIALPAVKVSIQAVTLQMAAAKTWGQKNYTKLDPMTVTLSHPDGMAAMLSRHSEVDAHFTSPPFQYEELQHPGVHTVLNSFKLLGGPATFNLVWTTQKFHNQNPKTYAAFVAALQEAENTINHDKHAAAAYYKQVTHDKQSVDFLTKMISAPDMKYTLTPQNMMKYAAFMHQVGSIKVMPSSWKDMFFSSAYGYKGS
jgi:NitT/TauT family transport system substrate-binding protein